MSSISKNTKSTYVRILGGYAVIQEDERNLEETFDMYLRFPSCSLVKMAQGLLGQNLDEETDHIESSGVSSTTLEFIQRERRLHDEEIGVYLSVWRSLANTISSVDLVLKLVGLHGLQQNIKKFTFSFLLPLKQQTKLWNRWTVDASPDLNTVLSVFTLPVMYVYFLPINLSTSWCFPLALLTNVVEPMISLMYSIASAIGFLRTIKPNVTTFLPRRSSSECFLSFITHRYRHYLLKEWARWNIWVKQEASIRPFQLVCWTRCFT